MGMPALIRLTVESFDCRRVYCKTRNNYIGDVLGYHPPAPPPSLLPAPPHCKEVDSLFDVP